MNVPEDFKNIARQVKRASQKESLPKIRTSLTPLTSAKSSPHSSSPTIFSKRSSSTDKLPGLKDSKTGLKSIGSIIGTGRCSLRSCGIVKAYAVNSFAGKHHHEDRVSIIMNIQRPATVTEENWPKSSYFGLYDGHSGKGCAEYLKSHLSEHIFNDPNFPFHIKKAILTAFVNADEEFMDIAKVENDMSGSSAIVVIIIGDKCFVAGTGDSRAIISLNGGKSVIGLNSEHTPADPAEYDRVIRAGGKVYNAYFQNEKGENIVTGPLFVSPGKQKVSRSFGDIDAKDPQYGGNPKVLICTPDIKSFKIKSDQDFLILATAPMLEKITNREIVDILTKTLSTDPLNLNNLLLSAIEEIFTECISRRCEENMTLIVIALKTRQKSLKLIQ